MRELKKVVEGLRALSMDFTCEQVYTTLAAGTGATLFASLIPGASSITNIAGKVIL